MAQVNLRGSFNPPTYLDTRIDVYAYLVVTGSGIILIDTGVGEDNAYIEHTFEPHRSSLKDALARFELSTTDIAIVVNSHLHFDHCGNNRLFPNAEFFMQKEELEIARTSAYTVRDWFDYDDARIIPVSGDLKIAPGISLISSPGHTPGHQSVLIESGNSAVLVAAQASFTADEFRRGGDPAEQAHEGFEQQYRQSIVRLKSVGAEAVYFSHDEQAITRIQTL